jgi:hypothetical protein
MGGGGGVGRNTRCEGRGVLTQSAILSVQCACTIVPTF